MTDPVKLVTTKPDVEVAAEIKKEIAEAYKPLGQALTKAAKLGFVVNMTFSPDGVGEIVIQQLTVAKYF